MVVGDLQLGDEKITLNHLVSDINWCRTSSINRNDPWAFWGDNLGGIPQPAMNGCKEICPGVTVSCFPIFFHLCFLHVLFIYILASSYMASSCNFSSKKIWMPFNDQKVNFHKKRWCFVRCWPCFLFGSWTESIWTICSSKWVHLPQFSGWTWKIFELPPPMA